LDYSAQNAVSYQGNANFLLPFRNKTNMLSKIGETIEPEKKRKGNAADEIARSSPCGDSKKAAFEP